MNLREVVIMAFVSAGLLCLLAWKLMQIVNFPVYGQ